MAQNNTKPSCGKNSWFHNLGAHFQVFWLGVLNFQGALTPHIVNTRKQGVRNPLIAVRLL